MKHVWLIFYKNFENNKHFPKQLIGKQYSKICKTLCFQKFNTIYLNLYTGKWVLARRFILTYVCPLKIFQILGVRILYKSIVTIEFFKNKVPQRSPFRHLSETTGENDHFSQFVSATKVNGFQ